MRLAPALFTAAALLLPAAAWAESKLVVGAGTAAARLDFKVVVPRYLFFAVGSGYTTFGNRNTIDNVLFDYTSNPAALGTGAPAAVIVGNAVKVRVKGNNGQISITSSNVGPLNNGPAGDTIPWTQIGVVSLDPATFPSPPPSGATVNVTPTAGKVTFRTTTWTYSYLNSAVRPPGDYGSTNGTRNARVTYTAAMP